MQQHHRIAAASLVIVASASFAGAASVARSGDDEQAERIALGRKVWGDCSGCHFVPDRTIARDRAWLALIASTA